MLAVAHRPAPSAVWSRAACGTGADALTARAVLAVQRHPALNIGWLGAACPTGAGAIKALAMLAVLHPAPGMAWPCAACLARTNTIEAFAMAAVAQLPLTWRLSGEMGVPRLRRVLPALGAVRAPTAASRAGHGQVVLGVAGACGLRGRQHRAEVHPEVHREVCEPARHAAEGRVPGGERVLPGLRPVGALVAARLAHHGEVV
mmetsp:Transcript_2202/g.6231  ORF Transcript_2202/g.6231 Transcript_2202/m.6231 type:complete len:203 (-) Transcript_2202:219-827(-)